MGLSERNINTFRRWRPRRHQGPQRKIMDRQTIAIPSRIHLRTSIRNRLLNNVSTQPIANMNEAESQQSISIVLLVLYLLETEMAPAGRSLLLQLVKELVVMPGDFGSRGSDPYLGAGVLKCWLRFFTTSSFIVTVI